MKLDARDGISVWWQVFDAATGAKLNDVVSVDDVAKEMVSLSRNAARRVEHDGQHIKYRTERLRAVHIDALTKTVVIYRIAS